MSRRPERKLERKRKGKLVKKMERKLSDVKASSHRVMKVAHAAANDLDAAERKVNDLNRQREVLLRVIAVVAGRHGGSFEIPYAELMAAPPILVETVKGSDGATARVRMTLLPPAIDPASAACCDSSHPRDAQGQVVDKACPGPWEMGANGRCVYCDHAEGCHPGDPIDPRPHGRPL